MSEAALFLRKFVFDFLAFLLFFIFDSDPNPVPELQRIPVQFPIPLKQKDPVPQHCKRQHRLYISTNIYSFPTYVQYPTRYTVKDTANFHTVKHRKNVCSYNNGEEMDLRKKNRKKNRKKTK
jgi:hypothetical protein